MVVLAVRLNKASEALLLLQQSCLLGSLAAKLWLSRSVCMHDAFGVAELPDLPTCTWLSWLLMMLPVSHKLQYIVLIANLSDCV